MSLNIKDDETHELVRQLATLKGMSLTAAVKDAVKSEIERENARQGGSGLKGRKKRSDVLQAFARDFVSRVKDTREINSWDIDKLLYDENGFPK